MVISTLSYGLHHSTFEQDRKGNAAQIPPELPEHLLRDRI